MTLFALSIQSPNSIDSIQQHKNATSSTYLPKRYNKIRRRFLQRPLAVPVGIDVGRLLKLKR